MHSLIPSLPWQRMIPWLAGLLVLSILGASCAPSAPSGPVVSIDPPAVPVPLSNTMPVAVSAKSIENLTAFELHLSFDPEMLEVTELNNGGFIQADFVVQNTFDNGAGTIDYAVAQIDRPPANGSGALLEIVFRAKAPGQSAIRFRGTPAAPAGILLSDPDGREISVTLQEGNVDLSESSSARPIVMPASFMTVLRAQYLFEKDAFQAGTSG